MAITIKQAVEAIEGSGGFVTVISKRLGCSRMQVYRLRDQHDEIRQALEDEREAQLDFAEGRLQKQIKDDNTTALIFYLKTQGKSRGYIERQEITGADNTPLIVAIDWVKNDNKAEQVAEE